MVQLEYTRCLEWENSGELGGRIGRVCSRTTSGGKVSEITQRTTSQHLVWVVTTLEKHKKGQIMDGTNIQNFACEKVGLNSVLNFIRRVKCVCYYCM